MKGDAAFGVISNPQGRTGLQRLEPRQPESSANRRCDFRALSFDLHVGGELLRHEPVNGLRERAFTKRTDQRQVPSSIGHSLSRFEQLLKCVTTRLRQEHVKLCKQSEKGVFFLLKNGLARLAQGDQPSQR
jgi:hypothetical protein